MLTVYVGYGSKDSLYNKHNAIVAEALGIGGYASISYQRLLFHFGKLRSYAQLGLGGNRITDFEGSINPDISLPAALFFLYGKKHNLVIGAGNTITSNVVYDLSQKGKNRIYNNHATLFIGYLIHPSNRYSVRVGYTPIWQKYKHYKHWGGVALIFKI